MVELKFLNNSTIVMVFWSKHSVKIQDSRMIDKDVRVQDLTHMFESMMGKD